MRNLLSSVSKWITTNIQKIIEVLYISLGHSGGMAGTRHRHFKQLLWILSINFHPLAQDQEILHRSIPALPHSRHNPWCLIPWEWTAEKSCFPAGPPLLCMTLFPLLDEHDWVGMYRSTCTRSFSSSCISRHLCCIVIWWPKKAQPPLHAHKFSPIPTLFLKGRHGNTACSGSQSNPCFLLPNPSHLELTPIV